MDELKKLLGDDLYAQIVEKLGKRTLMILNEGQKGMVDDGTHIPKYRFDEVNEQKKGLQERLDQADKDLKALKKAAEGNTDLTKKIEELQASNKDAAEKLAEKEKLMKKSFAIKEGLLKAGVVDSEARDLLIGKFDLSKVELAEDGTIKGFDAMLAPIKSNKTLAGLFGTKQLAGQEHQSGENGTPISKLEAELAEAQKAGNLVQTVALKRKIAEENAKAASTQ